MPVDAILSALCLGGFFSLVLLAAANDIASMEIPDWISIALAALFPLAALHAGLSGAAIAFHFGVGFIVFVIGFGLFAANVLGGGDVKVIAAASIWTGLAGLPAFVLVMALAGGVLAAGMLLARRALPAGVARPAFLKRLLDRENGIPYAVAIAIGALVATPEMPLPLTLLGDVATLTMP